MKNLFTTALILTGLFANAQKPLMAWTSFNTAQSGSMGVKQDHLDSSWAETGSLSWSATLEPFDNVDNYFSLVNSNNAASVDISSPDAAYVELKVKLKKPGIKLDRFVQYGTTNFQEGIKGQLRWSVDNYATSLGEFTFTKGTTTLTSVSLSAQPAMSSPIFTFRIYYYNAAARFEQIPGRSAVSDGTAASYENIWPNSIFALWYNPQTATGLEEAASEAAFTCYPNPAADMVHINAAVPFDKAVLSNNLGQLVRALKQGSELSLDGIDAGLYYISLYNGQGALIATQKLQVSK